MPLCNLVSFETGLKPCTFCVVMRSVVAGSIHRGLSPNVLLKMGSHRIRVLLAGDDDSMFERIECILESVRAGVCKGLG
jgi:hypothetical protein